MTEKIRKVEEKQRTKLISWPSKYFEKRPEKVKSVSVCGLVGRFAEYPINSTKLPTVTLEV